VTIVSFQFDVIEEGNPLLGHPLLLHATILASSHARFNMGKTIYIT